MDDLNVDTIQLYDEEDIVLSEEEVEETLSLDGVEPPCVVVDGLLIEIELEFLHKHFDNSSETSVPLYVNVQGVVSKVGNINLSLNNILLLRYLGYKSTLVLPEGKEIDLLQEDNYPKFFTI